MKTIDKVKQEIIESMAESYHDRAKKGDGECHCSMRIALVGDGCSVCNPEYYAEMMKDEDSQP